MQEARKTRLLRLPGFNQTLKLNPKNHISLISKISVNPCLPAGRSGSDVWSLFIKWSLLIGAIDHSLFLRIKKKEVLPKNPFTQK